MSAALSNVQFANQIRSCDQFSVRVITDAGEMESLREVWEDLNWNPNAQIDFFNLINAKRGGVLRPYVVLVEKAGRARGILVGRVVNQVFRCQVGYKGIDLGRVRELSIVYGGAMVGSEEDSAQAALDQLVGVLGAGEVDLVMLSHLNTTSSLFNLAKRRLGLLRREHFITPQTHWRTGLSGNWDDFLKRLNKKHRYWLRRLERLMEEDFPGQVQFRSFTDGSHLDEMLRDIELVAKKTYQRQLGAGFVNNPEYAARLELEASKGWLRGFVLYIKGTPCAFWLGTLYKGLYHSGFTGYDPDLRTYEPGTVAFMRMVQHLCEEKAAGIDYGLGDALYKQRFGDSSWQEASLRLFAPSPRGIGLNMTQTTIAAPVMCARYLLNRTQLQQRIKTLWRRRLAGGKTA